MASRHADWLRQARRDLEHARHALRDGEYEWSCFAAHQAAEKAVKALYQKLGADAWGHSVSILLSQLPSELVPPPELLDRARELDKHYIPPRYPNSHPQGAPMDYYTLEEAERAVSHGEEVISFCEDKISGPGRH
ncbi:HEPN domain-containing protein [Candidatus Solincola sp.]|nr:HEPN domain-containing protein [Actinomycetota bacterium]MDI7250940.1 HEPN domain-containing protein [Actinomycetota bacterium]